MSSTATSPIDNDIYNRMSDTWWDEKGLLNILKGVVNPWRVPYFQRILRQLKIDPQGKRALDVGCGGGLLAEEFAAMGFVVTGIDPSDKSLQAARTHAIESSLKIDYRLGYGDKLACENESFEIVYCCDVLEHIENWDAVIGEIARVLKPGGVFFYDTINRTIYSKLTSIKIMQEWKFTRIMPPHLHVWKMFITPAELTASLQRHGLQNREIIGTKISGNPIKIIIALRKYRAGKISCGEFGKQTGLKEGTNISGSYMGYAVKPCAPFLV
ncbi:MAG: bifunctional 2-polyprenyl-6-hydroxyphenol methylase/3-demethylubiquinol 3-O-methyltransferase UbiG [Acidobacteriota bacterium]